MTYSVFLLTVWFLWPRELDSSGVGSGRATVPDYFMVNAHYVSVKAGHLEVETNARQATFNLAAHRMTGRNIVAFVFNAQDERTVISADRAVFHMDERVLQLNDNVSSLSPDGFLMESPEATYQLNQRLLTASRSVHGQTFEKDVEVWGDRAVAPLDEKLVRLYGNARSLYHEAKRGPTKIRGEMAILDREAAKVTFEKMVKVEQEKIEASSETADLFYSSRDHGIRYMSLNGDVKITQGAGKYTRSQMAEFFAPTDSIVLTGFPAVYDGNDAVTGDKITVYRATGVVEVTATNAAGAQLREKVKSTKQGEEKPVLNEEDEELIP